MDLPIVLLLVAVLAAFALSFLLVFHMPAGRWVEGVGLFFGGVGSVGLLYMLVILNEVSHQPPTDRPVAGSGFTLVVAEQ